MTESGLNPIDKTIIAPDGRIVLFSCEQFIDDIVKAGFLLKELWLNNYAKSDLRHTYGSLDRGIWIGEAILAITTE